MDGYELRRSWLHDNTERGDRREFLGSGPPVGMASWCVADAGKGDLSRNS